MGFEPVFQLSAMQENQCPGRTTGEWRAKSSGGGGGGWSAGEGRTLSPGGLGAKEKFRTRMLGDVCRKSGVTGRLGRGGGVGRGVSPGIKTFPH